MNTKYIYLLLLSAFTLLTACGDVFKKNNPTEGEIIFDVDYPDMGNSSMASVYPKDVTVKFKGGNTNSDFTTGMGMVSMINVANYDKKEVIQLLKIVADKKAAVYSQALIDSVIQHDDKYTITKVEGQTKQIAGYNCKKAIMEIGNSGKMKFDLYYTQDIDAKNCNWWSPFKSIDGVLMDYHAVKYGIHMHLTAREVKTVTVEDKVFALPTSYKQISVPEMDDILNNLK
ncbi:MAG: hypothetical protein H7331_09430 [Bacteroidia bacterium]|nr:hypothetical protein [Bacteroidia bacterium]